MELTPDEVRRVRDLLVFSEEIRAESEYRTARRLVLRTWKTAIVALGAVIGAALLVWDMLDRLVHRMGGV